MQQITQNESTSALRRIAFVLERAVAANEVQEVDLGDIGSGDTFTLTFDGQTTSAISFDVDMSSTIDTALEALSNIAASDITVTKGTGHVYSVNFGGTLAAQDVATLSITPTGFTAGGVTVTQTGGSIGDPVTAFELEAAELQISKNGAAYSNSAGSITEVGHGLYYYEPTVGEIDTLGFLALVTLREDIAMYYGLVQIVGSTSDIGAPVIRSSTAQTGGASTITLDASASSVTNFYVPSLVYLRSGTGGGQARLAHAYNGTTKILSVEPSWAVIPDDTTLFDLLPVQPAFADLLRANHTTTDTFGGDLVSGDIITASLDDIEFKTDQLGFTGTNVNATIAPTRGTV